jgi:hypothetical protein
MRLLLCGVRKLCLRPEAELADSILVCTMRCPICENEVQDGSYIFVGMLNDVMSLMVLFPSA